MYRTLLKIFIGVVVFFTLNATLSADTEITSFLTKKTLVQGAKTELRIELSWIGEPNSIEIIPPKAPDCYLMEIEQIKQENTFELFPEKSRNKISFIYFLKALEPGEGRVSSFVIEFTEKATGIKSIKKTDAYDITVLTKPQYILKQMVKTSLFILGGILIAGLILTVLYLKRKKKQQLETELEIASCSDYDNQILNELKSVLKYKISGETYKFFDQLSSILNRYFHKKLGLSQSKMIASTQSDNKISHEIPSKIIIEFKEIIAGCNNIKFSAKKMTSSDLESWYKRSEKLVRFFIKKSEHDAKEQQIQNINVIKDGGA